MKKILNKCPVCGSKLIFDELCQYSILHYMTAYGKPSKSIRRRKNGSLGANLIYCDNMDCDFCTDADYECEKYPKIKIWEENNKFWVDDGKEEQ